MKVQTLPPEIDAPLGTSKSVGEGTARPCTFAEEMIKLTVNWP